MGCLLSDDYDRACFIAQCFNQDIGDWDVKSVTNMSSMFSTANAFNQDIGDWDVSSVKNMTVMFSGAKAFNQDITDWDVSAVNNMNEMFSGAESFNQDIGNWDVSSVKNMAVMFYGANVFNQDITDWDVSAVDNMGGMFCNAESFNQDIGNWDVSSVKEMSGMFAGANSFNQDIGDWNVTSVSDMNTMFYNSMSFNQNLGRWNLSNVENLDNFLSNSGMDCEHYSTTLIGWNKNPETPNDLGLGAQTMSYGTNADPARNNLIENKGWTISGDSPSGIECSLNEPFVTTWKTYNPGITDINQIQIPGTGTSYSIAWSEVSVPAISDPTIGNSITTITFPSPGTYSVSITPGDGTFTRIAFNDTGDKEKILSIDQWGDISWTSMICALSGCC